MKARLLLQAEAEKAEADKAKANAEAAAASQKAADEAALRAEVELAALQRQLQQQQVPPARPAAHNRARGRSHDFPRLVWVRVRVCAAAD